MSDVAEGRPLAIIQARMGSTRLPGKTMADLGGRPVLGRVVERVRAAASVGRLVVATTTAPGDDPIAVWCREEGVECFRGDEQDVLDRFRACADRYGADEIVRVTADCPLLDPAVVDFVVGAVRVGGREVAYASNVIPPTFPDGLDVEIFRRTSLERAWRDAVDPSEREHVTLHFWRNAGAFRLLNVRCAVNRSTCRWTLDTADDLEAIRGIYALHSGDDPVFGMDDVLEALEAAGRPAIGAGRPIRRQNSLTIDELRRLLEGKDIPSVTYHGETKRAEVQ
jgi:spore coat polysaccharide biosynthesis protein SpsF (cytidylyltransferase family)